jgi:hypothetical protein
MVRSGNKALRIVGYGNGGDPGFCIAYSDIVFVVSVIGSSISKP